MVSEWLSKFKIRKFLKKLRKVPKKQKTEKKIIAV